MSYASTATLLAYLVDYDGPQLAALKTNRGRNMLAHAVDHSGMKEPFFGCELPERAYDRYFEGTADLHFAFQHAPKTGCYFFDNAFIEGKGDDVDLVPATLEERENPDVWPRPGIFSRSHTSLFNRIKTDSATKTFKIDGRWGASDFSHFYGKMSDLYALFAVLGRLEGTTAAAEKGFIAQALRERLWRGGGSYGGFYDELDDRNSKHNLARLEVSRIQYASPGQIDLRGNQTALAATSDVIAMFEDKWTALRTLYNEVHGALQRARLLKARPDTAFPSRAVKEFVTSRTNDLASEMRLENISEVYQATGPNALVYAKLILSIYRRARDLYMFQAEGRIQRK